MASEQYCVKTRWTDEQLSDFGIALNEATLIGAEVNPDRNASALTLSVLSLPEDDGPEPEDRRILMILEGVTRVAASLRDGVWDDSTAGVITFELDALLDVISGFKSPVYGWEFLDVPLDNGFAKWSNRLSLDWVDGSYVDSHTLTLFQGGGEPKRHLDLCLWFESMRIFRPTGEEIDFDAFTAAGKRWWDGLHAGDPRTASHGIHPGPFGANDM